MPKNAGLENAKKDEAAFSEIFSLIQKNYDYFMFTSEHSEYFEQIMALAIEGQEEARDAIQILKHEV